MNWLPDTSNMTGSPPTADVAVDAANAVDVPVYEFSTSPERVQTLAAAPIGVVEGILVLWDAELRALM